MDKFSSFLVKLFLVFAFSFFFGSNALASSIDVNDVVDTIVDLVQEDVNITLSNTSNTDFVSFCNDWINNQELHFSFWKYQNNYMQLMLTSNVVFNNDNTVSYTYSKSIRFTISNGSWSNYSTTGATSVWSLANGDFFEHGELMDELQDINVVYNPFYPSISSSLVYDVNGSQAYTDYNIPATLRAVLPNMYGDGYDTYFDIYYRFSAPNYVNMYFNNGEVVYTPVTFSYSDWYNWFDNNTYSSGPFQYNSISDYSTFQQLFTLGGNTNVMTSNFATFISDINSNIVWGSVSGIDPDVATDIVSSARTDFTTYNRTPLTFGNSLEVRIRVYRIQNGVKYASPWTSLVSFRPATFTLASSYSFGEGQNVSTSSTISTDSELPSSSDTVFSPVEYGDTTINSNNNVPNTMDYPTIADFNRDKLLVGYIQTAKQLPQFFGDFGTFLADAFVFIPDIIWSIVALGFSASIVVMILKIL